MGHVPFTTYLKIQNDLFYLLCKMRKIYFIYYVKFEMIYFIYYVKQVDCQSPIMEIDKQPPAYPSHYVCILYLMIRLQHVIDIDIVSIFCVYICFVSTCALCDDDAHFFYTTGHYNQTFSERSES